MHIRYNRVESTIADLTISQKIMKQCRSHGARSHVRENRNKFSWLRVSDWILDDSCRGVTNLCRTLVHVYGAILSFFSWSDESSLVTVCCREDALLQNRVFKFISTTVKLDNCSDFNQISACKASTTLKSFSNNRNLMCTDDTNYILTQIQTIRMPL